MYRNEVVQNSWEILGGRKVKVEKVEEIEQEISNKYRMRSKESLYYMEEKKHHL